MHARSSSPEIDGLSPSSLASIPSHAIEENAALTLCLLDEDSSDPQSKDAILQNHDRALIGRSNGQANSVEPVRPTGGRLSGGRRPAGRSEGGEGIETAALVTGVSGPPMAGGGSRDSVAVEGFYARVSDIVIEVREVDEGALC